MNRKLKKIANIQELANSELRLGGKRRHDKRHWDYMMAVALEREYVKSLSPKDLLDYRQERENEVFVKSL